MGGLRLYLETSDCCNRGSQAFDAGAPLRRTPEAVSEYRQGCDLRLLRELSKRRLIRLTDPAGGPPVRVPEIPYEDVPSPRMDWDPDGPATTEFAPFTGTRLQAGGSSDPGFGGHFGGGASQTAAFDT